MQFKRGVNREGVAPEIWRALGFAEHLLYSWGYLLVVTSLRDGHDHRPASLHNRGLAADIRTRNFPPGEKRRFAEVLGKHLVGYDVVLEKDHLHFEYQPKGQETWIKEVA